MQTIQRFAPALAAVAFAAVLAACGQQSSPPAPPAAQPAVPPAVEAPAASPAAPTAVEPAASAATASPWAQLIAQVGRYPHDGVNFLKEGPLAQRLQAVLGEKDYQTLLTNMETAAPLTLDGTRLFITGNKAHAGGSDAAAVVLDPETDALRVWLLSEGKAREFVDPAAAELPWPQDVQTMISNAQ